MNAETKALIDRHFARIGRKYARARQILRQIATRRT